MSVRVAFHWWYSFAGAASPRARSAAGKEIDARVKAFLDRPSEGNWPYIWIHATYLKVRQNDRIAWVANIIAGGVNSDGGREVLGYDHLAIRGRDLLDRVLRGLARRGPRGVRLFISDAHEGIKAAISKMSACMATPQRPLRPKCARPCAERIGALALPMTWRPGNSKGIVARREKLTANRIVEALN